MVQYQCLFFDELTLTQLYDVMALRQTVFVVEQDCPYLDADGKDQRSWHILGYAEASGSLVAYTRLIPKGLTYPDYCSIGRVVTALNARGKGVGRQLMQVSLGQIKRLFGDTPIKISAQSYLIHFYEELGFLAVGEAYLEDGIPHRSMIRE